MPRSRAWKNGLQAMDAAHEPQPQTKCAPNFRVGRICSGLEQVQLLPGSALSLSTQTVAAARHRIHIRNCTLQWPDAWAATFWTKSWIHTKYHRIAFVDDSGECIRDDPFASRRCEVGKGKAQGGGWKGRQPCARCSGSTDEARHTSATEPPVVGWSP